LLSASPTHCLYYSGDFDARGLQIAAYLQARYPGRCHPWRFDPDSYMTALQPGGIQASAHELDGLSALPQTFDSLIAFMRDRRTWAYQEGITQLLIYDITCVFS
jgi:hypothetical protein